MKLSIKSKKKKILSLFQTLIKTKQNKTKQNKTKQNKTKKQKKTKNKKQNKQKIK